MSEPFSYRGDPRVPPFDDKAPIAVVDGTCALCAGSARLISRLDRDLCALPDPALRARLLP